MWGIITAIIFGGIIGALGRLIVPGKQNMSMWLTVAVGVVAAFAGSGLAAMIGIGEDGWNFGVFLFQLGAAAIGVYLVATWWPKRSGASR